MADPYVRTAPLNVGACSATWYVDPLTEPRPGSDGTDPTFGQPLDDGSGNMTGAWGFLVPGPLKDVLTQEITITPDFVWDVAQAWSEAGGSITVMGLAADGTPIYGATPRVFIIGPAPGPTQQMAFAVNYDFTAYPAVPTPIRWSVRFSVPHSIVR